MRPIVPILIAWHDAMIETAFDRAELGATGSLKRRARVPRWLRILNGAEIALARALGRLPANAANDRGGVPLGDRLTRPAAIVVPTGLGAIAAIHAAWALGWRWPGGTDQALAERVVGADGLPPEPVVWAVAAVLGAAATAVAAVATGRREPILRAATWSVAGVLIARGTLGIPIHVIGGLDSIYARLDVALYSPLCLALGLGAALVARGSSPDEKRQPGRSAALRELPAESPA
jgi:hypothetical protein